MQMQTAWASSPIFIGSLGTVEGVPKDGMANGAEMHAQLMGTAGVGLELEPAGTGGQSRGRC